MKKTFAIIWHTKLLINLKQNMATFQVSLWFDLIFHNPGFLIIILGSQDDYDNLKEQVQLLIESMGVASSEAKEIMTNENMDKSILNL
jgi:hypothetical protein